MFDLNPIDEIQTHKQINIVELFTIFNIFFDFENWV